MRANSVGTCLVVFVYPHEQRPQRYPQDPLAGARPRKALGCEASCWFGSFCYVSLWDVLYFPLLGLRGSYLRSFFKSFEGLRSFGLMDALRSCQRLSTLLAIKNLRGSLYPGLPTGLETSAKTPNPKPLNPICLHRPLWRNMRREPPRSRL